MSRRPLLYAMLALALPLPALALEGGGTPPPGPAAISVSASLGDCGLAESTIVCRIVNRTRGSLMSGASVTSAYGSSATELGL